MDAFLDFVYCCTMGSSHSHARKLGLHYLWLTVAIVVPVAVIVVIVIVEVYSSSSSSANKCSSSQDATPIVETILCRIPCYYSSLVDEM